jgi:hypothetical protein
MLAAACMKIKVCACVVLNLPLLVVEALGSSSGTACTALSAVTVYYCMLVKGGHYAKYSKFC